MKAINKHKIAFEANYKKLKEFLNNTNKRPTEKTNKSLTYFVSNQLSSQKNNLDRKNKIKELINSYDLDCESSAFKKRYVELEAFLNETNKMPTTKTNKDLYSFVYKQLSNKNKNQEQKSKVEKLINSYDLDYESPSFKKRYAELEMFLNETSKRPTEKTNKSLAAFVSYELSKSNNNGQNKSKIDELIKSYDLNYESRIFKKRLNRESPAFKKRYAELETFLNNTNKRPTTRIGKSLYLFVNYQLSDKNNNLNRKNIIKALLEKYPLAK